MEDKIPAEIKNILEKFNKAGFQIFIVGGAVRDLLMRKEVSDWDFTTDAKPEEILKLFPEGFYDNKFGTVGVLIEEDGRLTSQQGKQKTEDKIAEITTMRKEGKYEDFRHPDKVSWTNKIEEDLARRDFAVNAMALGLESRIKNKELNSKSLILNSHSLILVDPFDGQSDIKNKLIRAVRNPDQRFSEDALRLIRAIRIATELEFEIEKHTFEAILKNVELIKEVSSERVRDELFKILASMNGYVGIVKLREAEILQIILPEVEKCFGIVQVGEKHARTYDIGEHSILTLKETPSSDPLVRFAALIHDIGKPETFKEESGNVTFYNHDIVSGRLSLKIAHRLNLSRKQTDKLYRLVRWHLFTVDERQTDSAIRRFIKNVGVENIDDMMALRVGDRLGGGTQKPTSWRLERFKERIKEVLKKPFSISDLKVNGLDVMKTLNIKPGPKVGEILQKLFKEVQEDSSKNTQEYLINKMKGLE